MVRLPRPSSADHPSVVLGAGLQTGRWGLLWSCRSCNAGPPQQMQTLSTWKSCKPAVVEHPTQEHLGPSRHRGSPGGLYLRH
jgi:hypothetical protein